MKYPQHVYDEAIDRLHDQVARLTAERDAAVERCERLEAGQETMLHVAEEQQTQAAAELADMRTERDKLVYERDWLRRVSTHVPKSIWQDAMKHAASGEGDGDG